MLRWSIGVNYYGAWVLRWSIGVITKHSIGEHGGLLTTYLYLLSILYILYNSITPTTTLRWCLTRTTTT